jgi:TIR domain
MAAPMAPSVPELVDFFVRLEDDPNDAGILNGAPFQIFQAAVKEGLVEHLGQDGFARVVGKAVGRELIGFEITQAGIGDPGPVWSDHDFQMRSGYFVTVQGRQMADLFRRQRTDSPPVGLHGLRQSDTERRDCFICHASEDKDVARQLAEALGRSGYGVWFDEYELRLGNSLRRKIDEGLANSRFGVVILSRRFFEKEWTQRELDGLTAREVVDGEQLILPVWHEIDQEFLASVSPTLADRVGVPSAPLEIAVKKIEEAVDQRRQAQTRG